MTRSSRVNRRTLLQLAGLGGTSLAALPWLSRVPSAHAQAGDIRRLVLMCLPNEPLERDYWAVGEKGARNVPLTGMASSVMAPLEPYMSQMRLIADINQQVNIDKHWNSDHSHIGIIYELTGREAIPFSESSEEGDEWAGGPSIDKYIAAQLGLDSLVLGVGARNNDGPFFRAFHWDAQVPATPTRDPLDSFAEVFADFTLSDDEFARRAAQRSSVVDVVARDLTNLSSRLPTLDRIKLERHLSDIRSLEAKLNDRGVLGCTEVPDGPPEVDLSYHPEVGRRQIDVAVQALRCDVRRIVALQIGDSGGMNPDGPWDWPEEGVYTTNTEHEVAHAWESGASAADERFGVQTFYMRQLRYLLDQLSAVDDGEGKTLLDSTLVMLVHPMGRGHSHLEHMHLLVGGNDFIKTGVFDSYNEEPHNKLLAGVCRAMGLDITSYGDPDYGGYIDLT
jgi:hypothetical protein